jgi:hypothetical protein
MESTRSLTYIAQIVVIRYVHKALLHQRRNATWHAQVTHQSYVVQETVFQSTGVARHHLQGLLQIQELLDMVSLAAIRKCLPCWLFVFVIDETVVKVSMVGL